MSENKRIRGFELVVDAPKGVKMPTRKTQGSAAYDFYLPQDVVVPAHGFSELVPTHIKAYMPEDEVLVLHIRSSIGLFDRITLANGTGIIDSDYYSNPSNDGNIGLVLQNNGDEDKEYKKGERVLQGIFMKFFVADNDNTQGKRLGGTGSTGK